MAKEAARGWRKYVPSLSTIVKVFVALAVIKVVNSMVLGSVAASAPNLGKYWPQIG